MANLVALTRREVDTLYEWQPLGRPIQFPHEAPKESDLLMILSESKGTRKVIERVVDSDGLITSHTKMRRVRKRLPLLFGPDETENYEYVPVMETVLYRIYQPIKIINYKK